MSDNEVALDVIRYVPDIRPVTAGEIECCDRCMKDARDGRKWSAGDHRVVHVILHRPRVTLPYDLEATE